ncbi:MAG: MATE family efflux transporter [Oscillospiraceae bacterium]|nr:MATE family efflux transporter [Oscillospiraceae bacterium]
MRTMPVGRLLFTMALPLALSMLVQALYNVVDSYFVSLVSTDAVTALSFAFPIQNLQIGCATGIAVGMNSLLSKSLGEGNQKQANRAAGNGIMLTMVLVAAFMLFGFFGTKPYYSVFGANERTTAYGISYTTICTVFTLGIFVEVLGERLLQASGRTVYTLFTQGTGAVLNIILDPLFILGTEGLSQMFGINIPFYIPRMEVAGAAVATVIGQWVAAIMAVIFNLTKNHDVQFALKYFKPQKDIIKKILAVGVPSMIMMAIGSIMNFCMNQIFMGFAPTYGQTPATVFGIYFRLQSFFLMPLFGINNASISIVAYNYGARQPDRITKTLKYALGAAMTIMLVGLTVFQTIPDVLMGIFGSSEDAASQDLVKFGISALRIVSLHFPIAAVGIALGASFQALGNGIYSTITSLCRQLVVLVPAAYLLSLTGTVDAVWWSFPLAEIVSSVLTVIFFCRIYKRKVKTL